MTKLIVDEPGMFCGWPANHGAWQRGDEWLFGFISALYDPTPGRSHRCRGALIKMQARSLDAGATWAIETPNVDFEGELPRPDPIRWHDGAIARFCGSYDHGGESCDPGGAVYLSRDLGLTWEGPLALREVDLGPDELCTARTCVVGDLALLSVRDVGRWGSDRVVAAKFQGGGLRVVGGFGDGGDRCVMPSAVRLEDEILAACRRRGRDCYVDLHASRDGGATWELRSPRIAWTGTHNGNPPALATVNNALVCVYGVRSPDGPRVEVSMSRDRGRTWYVIDWWECARTDLGYPVAFVRGRDLAVVFYEDVGDRSVIRQEVVRI